MFLAQFALTVNADDVPNPVPTVPGEVVDKANTVLGLLAWLGTAAAVMGIIGIAVMMVGSLKKGDAKDHIGQMLTVFVGCVLLASAGPLVSFVL